MDQSEKVRLNLMLERCGPSGGAGGPEVQAFQAFLTSFNETGVMDSLDDHVHNQLLEKINELEQAISSYDFDNPDPGTGTMGPTEENAQRLRRAIQDLQDAIESDIPTDG